MHELPITRSILDTVLAHSGDDRVTDVHLVAGELSGVVDDCIDFYWDILNRGTLAEGARLHVRRIPFRMECRECGDTFTPGPEEFVCAACGSLAVRVVSGDGVRVEAIDVEPVAADPSLIDNQGTEIASP